MNEIVNKFLLVGDKFMPEMHLKHLGFTYSVCGPFTKSKERIEKFMQTGNADCVYKNDHKRIQSDKVLRDKAFETVIQNMMDIKKDQLQQFTSDNRSNGSGIKNEIKKKSTTCK